MGAGKGTLKHLLAHNKKWDEGWEIINAKATMKDFKFLYHEVKVDPEKLLKLNKFQKLHKKIKDYIKQNTP